MIRAYAIQNDRLVESEISLGNQPAKDSIWIDLLEPGEGEDRQVEQLTGLSIPTREEMLEIEESSRFYAENDALYLTAPVLYAADTGNPGIAPVTFVLSKTHLVTVRYTSPQPFSLYTTMAKKAGNNLVSEACTPLNILLGLMEAITDRLADILESVVQRLDTESARLLSPHKGGKPMSTRDFRNSLQIIGAEGVFLSKVRESLAGLSRLLLYLRNNIFDNQAKKPLRSWLETLERDIQSLSDHVAFLGDRVIFLLDMVVGLVSVEQNAIIKIFSVAAVGFMPPTLIASIYGMNFIHMPELQWLLGYPWALGLMAVSALIPLLYFRRKGWL